LRYCSAGVFGECSLAKPASGDSRCDGIDEDCDGLIDEDILGTNSHCSKCGDVCPPGKDLTSVYDWGCSNKKCKAWSCKYPYFDVNNDPSDGCEVVDTVWTGTSSGTTYYKFTAAGAAPIGSISECGTGEIHLCNARIPRDGRQNILSSQNVSEEGSDYFYFQYIGGGFCVKEAKLLVVMKPLTRDVVSPNGTITVCVSAASSQLVSIPTFSSCKSTQITSASAHTVSFDNSYFKTSGDNYYYIKVQSASTYRFSGKINVQVVENKDDHDITGTNPPNGC
jgi:hypothetical protein